MWVKASTCRLFELARGVEEAPPVGEADRPHIHSRSINMLSMQRPLPSMLIVIPQCSSNAGERGVSELAALIGVEDFGLVVPCQGVLQGLDAELGAERVRQPSGQNRTTVPVHDRDQIQEPLGHR